jgi:hypothetical protein
MPIEIVVLSDLHFGPNKNNANIHASLKEVVYPYIVAARPDMIVIAGDDTDERMSLDQIATRYHLQFMNEIVTFATKHRKPCPVRFISGTEFHQKNQLQAYQYLMCDTRYDVKIFNKTDAESILGCKILYIPEESVTSKQAYYNDLIYSGVEYDLVFGHGMFDFIGNNGWGGRSERSLKGSPLWSYNDFANCVKGGVFFGHVHKATSHKDLIHYGGSLTRLNQGEEGPKGFLHIYYTHNQRAIVKFIENPLAPKYITKSFTAIQAQYGIDTIVQDLIRYVKVNNIYEFRIMANPDTIDLAKLDVIRNYFSQHPEYRIRVECVKGGDHAVTKETKEISLFQNKFQDINNPDDWELNTVQYANIEFGYTIDKSKMHELLNRCRQYDSNTISVKS